MLLPDNLLRSDSVIAKLVEAIPEEDWAEVEIIGWLYQFYISEKKDQVIGKVVKSEDIPAATQLFTPNWIVQYLVQNSVGRLWLMANPASTLAQQWPYYITPAEQTPEVQAQLDALIQTRVRKDGDSLNPETITVLDPACGSGHILVVAYDVLKAIYLERGYQPRAIPRLILEKNLYGLDIDDRAAQMAGFALLMKARADDRRLFNEPIKLNVLSLQESKGLDADVLTRALLQPVLLPLPPGEGRGEGCPRVNDFSDDDLLPGTRLQISLGEYSSPLLLGDGRGEGSPNLHPVIQTLITTFAHAKTFGSLIQIPQALNAQLAAMAERLQLALQNGDLYAKAAAQDLWHLVAQARGLGMRFDAVVANPPYMGGKGMNSALKDYAKATFPDSKSDLFAMFMERGFDWCKPTSFNTMVTMQSWMFLSSHEAMREKLLSSRTISNLVHVGYNSFPEMNSKIAQACAFSVIATYIKDSIGRYINLNSAPQSADKNKIFLERTEKLIFDVRQRLISYAIGCMMGRYSLDEPGLIYAHAGNVGFEPGRYATFPADADGIVPITDELWFDDDAPSRIREFLRAVWGPDTLEENMAWLAESLGKKSAKEATETPDETIRRYIADKFFKDHLQTYKKRPIYWLFSSGKQGAFQTLVYLHRYHEGTLARLRAEYVVPLTGKIQSRIDMLQKDATAASSIAARNKLAKEVEKLKKKHVELLAYDEQLRHYADMRITLDLDDGVKVNYGKFGDLLAEVKSVTGGTGDE